MLAAEHCPYYDGAMPNHELLEVHHSKISIHHAKAGYDYPAIHLPFTIMIAAEHYTDVFADAALPRPELLEIHRSKISLHHAKADYDYPTIHLPHSFSKLTGLPTRIYQTVHDGALAFLVVVSSKPTENASKTPKASVFTRRRSPVRIRPSPLVSWGAVTK
jgi:hypothetical protein